MTIKQMAQKLKLPYIKDKYELSIEDSLNQQHSYEQFLYSLLENEINNREKNSINKRIKSAKFPYHRTFEELKLSEFSAEVSSKIRELQSLKFLEYGRNVILIGNPGVGKTHIAIALGIKACIEGKSVLFTSVPNLITELKEAMTLNQLTIYKRKFMKYDLVILDELGYISFDKDGSELLFNLLSLRNDSKSIIITSNLTFNKWQDIFHDPILTSAMVDRICSQSYILNIVGQSYRLKLTEQFLK